MARAGLMPPPVNGPVTMMAKHTASPMGKLKTAYQSTALGMLLWHYPLDIPQIGLYIDVHSSGIIMLYISVILALVSGAEYFYLYYKQTLKNQNS